MARKSRKNREPENRPDQSESLYHVAVYARLSVEDNGVQGDSIENQITMIENYISKYPELKVVRTFVDNGETGTNFDRPAFVNMMEAVKKGTVNCIAVKDLSRFGRNYLETGNYLETIFPCLGIRFISVNDHFDSMFSGKSDTLLVPLKTILHDTYAKDISRKVSSAIDIKKKSGKFMGKIPPYGYVRDEKNRYQLRVHAGRAEIVRMIFRWRMEGLGPVSIAHRLNDMGVLTQFQIRYQEGYPDGKENALWRGSAVTDILKNPCYLGCIVERKESRLLYKGREKQVIPKAEWNLIANTHEPIVDRETFEEVQRLFVESKEKRAQQMAEKSHRQRTENLLSGMVQCGICGGSVHRDGGYFRKDGSLVRYRFYCSNKYIRTKGCSSRAVNEAELYHAVFQACRIQLELLFDMKELMNEMREVTKKSPQTNAQLNKLLQPANEELSENSHISTVTTAWIDKLVRFREGQELTREMCAVMVKKVVLNESSVSVHFAFADEYEKALTFLRSYERKCGDTT